MRQSLLSFKWAKCQALLLNIFINCEEVNNDNTDKEANQSLSYEQQDSIPTAFYMSIIPIGLLALALLMLNRMFKEKQDFSS